MRKLLPTIFSVILTVTVFAQQNKIDSIKRLLESHKEQDSIRLKMLNKLSGFYESFDAEEGLVVSDQVIALANKLGRKDYLAQAYINKAYNYMAAGKDSLALKLFYRSINIFISKKNIEGNASALYGIARIHQNWSDYEKAMEYYKKAYHLFDSIGNTYKKALILNGLGICFLYSSNYPKALETFNKALYFFEHENLTQDLAYASILSNLGLIYNRMQSKLELAIEYHERALEIYRKLGSKTGIANVLGNMANTYDNLNQPKKAIEIQQESYEINKDIGNKAGMANALTNIGIAYTSIPDYEKAIFYLKQTLPIYQELGNKTNFAIAECYLGDALLKLPITRKNLILSENYIKHAIGISKETGNLIMESEASDFLSNLYVKKGDYKNALEMKELAVKLKDSLTSQDLKDKITRLEVKYEYDKEAAILKTENDKKQALANAEIKRQRLIKNGSIMGGSILIVASIIGFVLYNRKRNAEDLKQEAEFNAKVSDTELKALRAQMNPHFIFNALNSINDFISKNDVASASKYLTKFAKIMRQTLENSTQNDITLEDDLKLLELYLQIETMRLKNKFTYTIEVDDDVAVENTLVPPLILQPFIENSIWHGISKKETGGHIQISIKKEHDMLLCIVDDNGIGRKLKSKELINKKKSLGLSITKSRIDILNKMKNTKGTMALIDKEEGLKVEVRLPLQLAF